MIPGDRDRPERLCHGDAAFGVLSSLSQAEGYQLAQVGKRLIMLPQELDLTGYIDQRIGLLKIDQEFLVREAMI
jgi:hypothetical protein